MPGSGVKSRSYEHEESGMPKRTTELQSQAQAIAEARIRMGLTQVQAAQLFNVPTATYRSWETGLVNTPPEIRLRMVREWQADPALIGETCPGCGRPWS
jgi:DNA-binding transcriptional regulator YiaG